MLSKYFKLHELLPEEIYVYMYTRVSEEVLWGLIDPKLIETIDAIKEAFPDGSMTINDYAWKGKRKWSGLRTRGSKYYSPTSQHTLGKAIDAVFSAYSTDEVRQYIIGNPEKFPHVKGIELGVSWLHVDVRDREDVLLFYP